MTDLEKLQKLAPDLQFCAGELIVNDGSEQKSLGVLGARGALLLSEHGQALLETYEEPELDLSSLPDPAPEPDPPVEPEPAAPDADAVKALLEA